MTDQPDPDVEHAALGNDAWMEAATKVSDFAREQGLHGIMILSPRCPGCGMLHDWHMMTDTPMEQADSPLADLLEHYAAVVRGSTPELIDETPLSRTH